MFQRKPRRFRHRSNGRGQSPRPNGHMQSRPRSNSFTNNSSRNNFRNNQSPEKLLDKYNTLAKEAISAGDKTLGENYLQHADHFIRIIEDRNKSRELQKNSIEEKVNEDKPLPENVNVKQEEVKQ